MAIEHATKALVTHKWKLFYVYNMQIIWEHIFAFGGGRILLPLKIYDNIIINVCEKNNFFADMKVSLHLNQRWHIL